MTFPLLAALRTASTVVALTASCVWAADAPRIAVTDLSYEETVSGYFEKTEVQGKRSSERNSGHDDMGAPGWMGSERNREDVSYRASRAHETRISRGELRKFTADIKGQLINSGYRVVQGRPWTDEKTDTLYDIIERIRQGHFAGADYVLFGTVSNVEFRQDVQPVHGTTGTTTGTLSLELAGEFSLIDTRTHEVRAAFSALGEGADTRLTNAPGARVSFNRSRVMTDVARSLGTAVAEGVAAQLSGTKGTGTEGARRTP